MNIEDEITKYLHAVDESLDVLSKHEEGKLSRLPSWVLQKRHITIGVTKDGKGVAIKISPDNNLEEDRVTIKEILTTNDVSEIISPMNYGGNLPNNEPPNNFVMFSDMSVVEANNPLAVPVLDNNFVIGWGSMPGFTDHFDMKNAKEISINLWNNAKQGLKTSSNFIQETRKVFDKMQAIIKRKAFLERRVHRFVNEHRNILLPSHKNCFYEHKLFFDKDMRKADFILEREQGLPSIFIELESPVHKVFTKKHDLTAPANHARQQISEWVQFVENDPHQNAQGDFGFLTGPKERMVIIGRGVEERQHLIKTKFDGVTFWTYSIMIEEAKNRMNNLISLQYELLGLDEVKPF